MTEKSEKLYDAMTGISDELIKEAEEYSFEGQKDGRENRKTSGKKKIHYLKWGLAVAACLCVFGCGVLSGMLLAESREENPLKQTATNEERKGFQFLVQNMAVNFSNDDSQNNAKDILMSNYMNAYLNVTTEGYKEISDLYRLYGITSGEKIEKIVCKPYQQSTQTQFYEITDASEIKEFYALSSLLARHDTDAFFRKVVDKMSVGERAAFHAECRFLEITTSDGLVFSFSIYPESGWLYSGGTMSYYALSEELLDWYEKNCSE